MPSASWLNGWLSGDQLTAAELGKGVGSFFDSTLGSAAATFDITSIPTWGSHLMIELYGRGDTASANVTVSARFNNDSGANYGSQGVAGNTTSTTAGQSNSSTSIPVAGFSAASATANHPGSLQILIPHFRGTMFFKQVLATYFYSTAITSSGMTVAVQGGVWASTAAVTRVTFILSAGNFVAGSRCTAYVLGP